MATYFDERSVGGLAIVSCDRLSRSPIASSTIVKVSSKKEGVMPRTSERSNVALPWPSANAVVSADWMALADGRVTSTRFFIKS